jgi:hypothetical protein
MSNAATGKQSRTLRDWPGGVRECVFYLPALLRSSVYFPKRDCDLKTAGQNPISI